jgi:glyoxylase-like metal-dependent hydrolase (beta-lactamase superfamily II)
VLRTALAPNASALTLDGTRTHLVGGDRVVVLDPGSAAADHLDAIAGMVGDATVVALVVTHAHPDHAAGADELATRFGCEVRMARRGTLRDGDRLDSDAGHLVALATPGHTPDHMALHWPAQDAVFCGDLMMGGQDTALVAPPQGQLGPYLASLERIRRLRPRVIHPAHGPPFPKPDQALDRYVRHRRIRLDQVRRAVRDGVTEAEALQETVYGPDLDPALAGAARAALRAYLEHLQGLGEIRRVGRGWEPVPG